MNRNNTHCRPTNGTWGSEKQGTKSTQKQEDDLNTETSFFPLAR